MLDLLIAVLCAVESGGSALAVGDSGRAVGILQIHEAAWQDGCRFLNVNWPYPQDAFDPERSKAVCRAYLLHYGGLHGGAEKWARIWNGGPRGHQKACTLQYWRRVEEKLAWFVR